jgi:hypothetical protein
LYGIVHVFLLQTSPHPRLILGKNGNAFLNHKCGSEGSGCFEESLGFDYVSDERLNVLLEQIKSLKLYLDKYNIPTLCAFIPQKPLLDNRYLPYHIRKFIPNDALENPLELRIVNNLPQDIAGWIFYPFDEVKNENTIAQLYPKQNFHWAAGPYTALYAKKIAEKFKIDSTWSPIDEFVTLGHESELYRQYAGFSFSDPTYKGYKNNLFSQFGITQWNRIGEKYPELSDIVQYNYGINDTGTMKKLLWLGDSFSYEAVQDLSCYFGEVLGVDIFYPNTQLKFSAEESRRLLDKLIRVFRPDYIIFESHHPFALQEIVSYLGIL